MYVLAVALLWEIQSVEPLTMKPRCTFGWL